MRRAARTDGNQAGTRKPLEVKWYVFDESGPYRWERSERKEGPYYDEVSWFDRYGYETEEDAIAAIEAFFEGNQYGYGPFFIMIGYCRAN